MLNAQWVARSKALGFQAAHKVVADGGLSRYERNVIAVHKLVAKMESDSKKRWKVFGSLTTVHPVLRADRNIRSMLNENCPIKRMEMFPKMYGLTMAKLGPEPFDLSNDARYHHSTIAIEIDSEDFLRFAQDVIFTVEKAERYAKLGDHSKGHPEQIAVVAERVIIVDGPEKRIAAYMEHVLHALHVQANTDQFNRLVKYIWELSTKDLVAASRMMMNSYKILKLNPGQGPKIKSKLVANFIRELVLPRLDHRTYIYALYKYILILRGDVKHVERLAQFFSSLSFELGEVDSMTHFLFSVIDHELHLGIPNVTPLSEVKQEAEMEKFLIGAIYQTLPKLRATFFLKYDSERVSLAMLTAEKRIDRCKAGTSSIFQTVYGIPSCTPNFDRAVLFLCTIPKDIYDEGEGDDVDIESYKKPAKIQAKYTHLMAEVLQDAKNKNGQFKGMIEFYHPDILGDLLGTYILPAKAKLFSNAIEQDDRGKLILVPAHYCIDISITALQVKFLKTHTKYDARKYTQAFYEAFLEKQSGEKEVSPRPAPDNGKQSDKKVTYSRLAQVLSSLSIRRDQIGDFVQFLLDIVSDLHSITETDTALTAPIAIHQVKDNPNKLKELFSSLDHSKTLVRRVIFFSKYEVPTVSVPLAIFVAERKDQCMACVRYILRTVYEIPAETQHFDKATASPCTVRDDITDNVKRSQSLAEDIIRIGETYENKKVINDF